VLIALLVALLKLILLYFTCACGFMCEFDKNDNDRRFNIRGINTE